MSMELSEFVFHIVCEMNDAKFLFPVHPKEEKKRLDYCLNCPHYNAENEGCILCNCYVPNKVKHLYEECPIEKWGRNVESWNETYYDMFVNKVIEKYPEAEQWKNQIN